MVAFCFRLSVMHQSLLSHLTLLSRFVVSEEFHRGAVIPYFFAFISLDQLCLHISTEFESLGAIMNVLMANYERIILAPTENNL